MTRGFFEAFGHDPEGIWAAPGRLNIIGEFTDYNDGFVLPMAIEAVTTAAVARRHDDVIRVSSSGAPATTTPIASSRICNLTPGNTASWSSYAFGVVWAMTEAGHAIGGVDVFIESNVPIGAGLSSSAALECALGLALRDLFASTISLQDLALLCQRAENAYVGVPSGIMDQTASLCCTAGHAIEFDTRSGEIEQVNFDLSAAGLELLVIDTQVHHQLATSAYGDRRSACELAAKAIGVKALRDATLADLDKIPDDVVRRRARHVITENERVLSVAALLRSKRFIEVGPILSAGHQSLKDDFEVSCAELDLAVDTATHAGAFGARMIGGGFGGCVIALIRSEDQRTIERSVTAAFASDGFTPPRIFGALPSPGAHRVM
jgi:galactokinase